MPAILSKSSSIRERERVFDESEKDGTVSASYFDDPANEEAFRFLIVVGTMAHGYGIASDRLQAYLERVAATVGLQGRFEATPSSILFVVWLGEAGRQHIHYAPMSAPGFDLARLSCLSGIMDKVAGGTLSIPAATEAMNAVSAAPAPYGPIPIGLGFAVCGAGFGLLMGLGWLDIAFAGLCSLVVFALTQMSGRFPWIGTRLEFLSAFAVALLAGLLAASFPGSDRSIVTLSGLITLMPGYGVTIGIAELASGQISSGMQRLASAVISLLKLFLGAFAGSLIIAQLLSISDPTIPAPTPAIWAWVFVGLLVIGLGFIFQARPHDLIWVMLGGLIAYAGIVLGAPFGPWQGSLIGTFGLVVFANLYSMRTGQPTSTVTVPAIMILVPGASALLGLRATAAQGAVSGLATEWQVLLNIGAIIAGLVIAHVVVPPRATL